MTPTATCEINIENAKLIQNLVKDEGHLESPIDLDISYMKVIELNPLQWINIDVAPRKLKITNTGYTIVLSATWQERRAYLSGGPFAGDYVFSQIHFHWGKNEMVGSEHSIDGASMPMELHAVHFKTECKTFETALRRSDGVTILVYFFKLQNEPNQFMEEIVKSVEVVRTAQSSARILPMQLTDLMKPFNQDYFLYWGSLITINNVHRILWVTSRVPIGISSEQIAELRTLNDEKGMPILSNVRPLQERQGRHVFHVRPSGSTYASLLPLPRVFLSDETEKTEKTGGTVNDTLPEIH